MVSLNEASTVDSPLIRLLIGVAVHQKTLFNAIAILKNFENIFGEILLILLFLIFRRLRKRCVIRETLYSRLT